MALQVTGNLKCGLAYYINPQLQLDPQLVYRGGLNVITTVNVDNGTGTYVPVCPLYFSPSTNELVYPTPLTDPYSDLIYALETYIIDQLQPENPDCTFTRF